MKGTEQNGKLYPFSGTKHAHDIDFRRSRVKNELAEAIQLKGNRLVCVISDEEYEALEKLEEQLDDLIGYDELGLVLPVSGIKTIMESNDGHAVIEFESACCSDKPKGGISVIDTIESYEEVKQKIENEVY